MKKLMLMFAVMSCLVAQTQAQGLRNRSQFGIKVGLNYANVYDTQGEKFNAEGKLGLTGGFFLTLPIGKLIGIQPEILFSQKGFHATGTILGTTYDLKRTTSYIDFPLLLTVKPNEIVSIVDGPQISYLFRQKDVFANGAVTIEQEKEFNRDNLRRNIFGLVVGLDVNITRATIGLRGTWDFQNNNSDGSSYTPRYKNAVLQATIGYKF
jgi:hypothetical protein